MDISIPLLPQDSYPSTRPAESCIWQSKCIRVSCLTDCLIRLEYDAEGLFEDRASQAVVNRNFASPSVKIQTTETGCTLETDALRVTILDGSQPFSKQNLTIQLKKQNASWHFGMVDAENPRGTIRTLDHCDGMWETQGNHPVALSNSLISPSGWSVLEDSETLLFDEAHKGLLPRKNPASQDFYFWGYGKHYKRAIKDYYQLCGSVPLLPKWALGLWWSRWESYTSEQLETIADEFESNGVPLNVCVIDMDWHLPGWTGYTWNPQFFPDPVAFFERMHKRGIHACLNLHPADGCKKHEAAYSEMAHFMGIDPASGEPIAFQPSNPRFMEAYFKFLHHPREKEGVDFWWIDWQQGTESDTEGLDPLWFLNHKHTVDRARDGTRRPFIFSRWSGAGGHRYPIGFSGDTYRTWESLHFQAYFTANSANVGYGWWSHDVGGFARGPLDDELYTRWVQLGCWSPILRLHNCGDPTLDYRPWSKSEPYKSIALAALKQRRQLIPYIYTASWLNHTQGQQLVTPLYHHYPEAEEAYLCPRTYHFGESMIVAPATQALNPDTGRTRVVTWLPEGSWCDFYTGKARDGGRWHAIHAALDETPAFVRAGSVIPSYTPEEQTELLIFAGAEGEGYLYEDAGEGLDYRAGDYSFLKFTSAFNGQNLKIGMQRESGNADNVKISSLRLRGFYGCRPVACSIQGEKTPCQQTEKQGVDWILPEVSFAEGVPFEIHFESIANDDLESLETVFSSWIRNFQLNSHSARRLIAESKEIVRNPERLKYFACDLSPAQRQALSELFYSNGADFERMPDGSCRAVFWHCDKREDFSAWIAERVDDEYVTHAIEPNKDTYLYRFSNFSAWNQRRLFVRHGDLFSQELTSPQSSYIAQSYLAGAR